MQVTLPEQRLIGILGKKSDMDFNKIVRGAMAQEFIVQEKSCILFNSQNDGGPPRNSCQSFKNLDILTT